MFTFRSIKNGVEVYATTERRLVVSVMRSRFEGVDFLCYYPRHKYSDDLPKAFPDIVKRRAQEEGIKYLVAENYRLINVVLREETIKRKS